MSRPEHSASAELYYNEKEAVKYTYNSRNAFIQEQMTERCIELLNLPPNKSKLILDVGCGSGLSGDTLTANGHFWIGLDISKSMLQVAQQNDVEGDLIQNDLGQGFGFRAGVFDGAISVSALQWLCYSDQKDKVASRRLIAFFSSLYKCLRRGARAVLQIYPENPQQLELISTAALRTGFTGGVVVDFPNSTKAKKYYLCLFAGVDPGANAAAQKLPAGKSSSRTRMDEDEDEEGENEDDEIDDEDEEGEMDEGESAGNATFTGAASATPGAPAQTRVAYESRRGERSEGRSVRKFGVSPKNKEWILKKKAIRRGRGVEKVGHDSKYTGRKRSKFRV
jgi:18S rRNA (guanine1575-N7)-methyltransferase